MKNLTETKARGFKVENGKLVYFTNILEGYRHEFKDLQEICKEMNGMMEKHDSYMAQIEFWKCDAETYKIWKDKLIEELKQASEKVRRETIKELVEFAEDFFEWDEEGFVRTLKECYEDELKEN